MEAQSKSLQERYSPKSSCFGCGPVNDQGLRIRSFATQDETGREMCVASWQSSPHHEAFPGMLNGGIIGALLDCHSNWTAAYYLMKAQGLDSPPCSVTADFHVVLKRPTSTAGPIELRAWVEEMKDDRALIRAELHAGGKLCATCTGTFVQVKPGHPAYHRW